MDPWRLNYKHDQCLPIDPSINMSNDYLLSTIKKINFDMNPSNKVWYFIKTTIQHRVKLMVEGLEIKKKKLACHDFSCQNQWKVLSYVKMP